MGKYILLDMILYPTTGLSKEKG